MKIGSKELLWMYRQMVRIRVFEEKMRELYMRGLVPGTMHLYIGQEAVAAGVTASLTPDDYVVSTHRGHAHSIAKGVPLRIIAAEILGKATGCCGGKAGSMHLSYMKTGLLYSSAIVGAGVPLATGAALSIKMRKTKQVVVCFFGDGACNTGGFHEGLNMASVWKLPVIFVCENNFYAISVSVKKSTSIENIADRAYAYSMPGIVVNGTDAVAVYKATCEAVKRARRGEGPSLIECKTYRWLGHFVGDILTLYRTKEEVEEWKRRCPIEGLKKKLLKKNVASESDLIVLQREIEAEVDDAVRFAIESPFPAPQEFKKYVF